MHSRQYLQIRGRSACIVPVVRTALYHSASSDPGCEWPVTHKPQHMRHDACGLLLTVVGSASLCAGRLARIARSEPVAERIRRVKAGERATDKQED